MRVTIVGGCGHVGLPLGIALVNSGVSVRLLDSDQGRVAGVTAGELPFAEKGGEVALDRAIRSGRLTATTEPSVISDAEVVILTIGTPVDEFLDPKVGAFDRCVRGLMGHFRDGQLLVLRSTAFPGLTERLDRWLRREGRDIDVAYCPERIAQGNALNELYELPQIVSGTSPRALKRGRELFQLLGVKLIDLKPLEAELAKLFANSYRYINFAISNQFYLIANHFGADFYRIHGAVTTDYPRMAGFSPAGFAAGPCLLKDTMQLAAFNHNTFLMGQAAMMINEGLPKALVDDLKTRRDLSRDTAAILGMAFKGDSDDPRDSLSYKLRKILALECAEVLCTDPYIDDPSFVPLQEALDRADVVFIGSCHSQYRDLEIRQPVVDAFDFLRPAGRSYRQAG